MKFVAGDLLATAPRETWPTLEELLPPGAKAIAGLERIEGFAYDGAEQQGVANPEKRLAWLDEIGIELRSGAASDLQTRLLNRHRLLVRARRGDHVEHIGDGNQTAGVGDVGS